MPPLFGETTTPANTAIEILTSNFDDRTQLESLNALKKCGLYCSKRSLTTLHHFYYVGELPSQFEKQKNVRTYGCFQTNVFSIICSLLAGARSAACARSPIGLGRSAVSSADALPIELGVSR